MNAAIKRTEKYKPYPEYKDSGVEWLGDVPDHWDVKKLKRVGHILTGNTPPKSDLDNYEEDGLPWVKPDDLGSFTPVTTSKEKLSEKGKKLARIIPEGAVLVCCIGSVGKLGIAGCELATNQQINSIIFSLDKIDTSFGQYALFASEQEYIRMSNKNVVAILNSQSQGNIYIPIPKLTEQHDIAGFLHSRSDQIDELIVKKKRVIELLREKRTALISHAVTKGLNPDAKMKDSRIDWLEHNYKFVAGDRFVPWLKTCTTSNKFKPLKYLSDMNANVLPENTPPNTDIIYIDISSVNSDGKVTNQEELDFDSAPSRARRILSDGDVFLSTVRTYLRAISYVEKAEHNLICSTGFAVISPGSEIYPKFLFYWVRSSLFVDEVVARSVGVSYPAINALEVGNLPFPMIDINEQQAIADFLDREISKIDGLIAKVTEAIEKLKEYRTALISAAVTGKIDVRKEV